MSLNQVFYPNSIAVIGASQTTGSVGNDLIINLLEYSKIHQVFPINPKYTQVEGLKCFANLSDLSSTPDLLIIALPAKFVVQAIKEYAEIGGKALVVISAGFKEIGQSGLEMEIDIAKVVESHGMTMLGVNCLGVMNTEISLNASFAPELPAVGNIALVAQSGALCTAAIDFGAQDGIGFSKVISIGNKTSLSEGDILEYLQNDKQTKAIMVYLEDIKDTKKLLQVSQKITKPVIVLKAGRTVTGQLATSSHTGALSGSDKFYQALFHRAGFTMAHSFRDFFDKALVLCANETMDGNQVAILTNAGGPGSLATDVLENTNLGLAKLSAQTTAQLTKNLPAQSGIANPVDVLGDSGSDRYEFALEELLKDKNVNGVLVILTPQKSTQILQTAKVIINLKDKYKSCKPIVACFMGSVKVQEARTLLWSNGIAIVNDPESAIHALSSLNQKSLHEVSVSVDSSLAKSDYFNTLPAHLRNQLQLPSGRFLDTDKVFEILNAYDLPVNLPVVAKDVNQAKEALLEMTEKYQYKKFALKIVSPDVVHKSDVGGVKLDVEYSSVELNFNQILASVSSYFPNAKIQGIEISPMVESTQRYELIFGVTKQPSGEHLVMFGLGGVLVELLQDVSFALAPLNKSQAIELLKSINAKAIFSGVRDIPAIEIDLMADYLVRISCLVSDFEAISELDINPIIIGKGLPFGTIVDARIKL